MLVVARPSPRLEPFREPAPRAARAGKSVARSVEPADVRPARATPMRQGSRAARSPPGSGSGARWPSARPIAAPVEQHQLAAPGAAVVAHAIAVERDAENRARVAMLRARSPRHGRRDAGRAAPAGPISSAKRVEKKSGCRSQATASGVTSSDRRRCAIALLEEANAFGVVEIADMLRDESFAPARHRDGRLEMRAAGERRRGRLRRDRSARAQSRARGAGRRARRRRSAMTESSARTTMARSWLTMRSAMPCESPTRLVVVDDERLAAGIGAGRDQHEILRRVARRACGRARRGVKQQMMQRRIGQHRRRCATGRARSDGASAPAMSISTIGTRAMSAAARSSSAVGSANRSTTHIRHHHREGLGVALLAAAQLRDRASRCARRTSDDSRRSPSARRSCRRARQRRFRAAACDQARAAAATGDRLGVKAAVCRVGVVARAGRAHGESAPSTSARGRRARLDVIVKRGPQCVQLTKG